MQEEVKKFETLFDDVRFLKEAHEQAVQKAPRRFFGLTLDPRISIDGMVVIFAIAGGIISYTNLQAQVKVNQDAIGAEERHVEKLDDAIVSISQSLTILTTTVAERTGKPVEK